MTLLTEAERKLLALALFSFAMKHGLGSFTEVAALVSTLKIEEEYIEYAERWLAHKKTNLQ